MISRRSVIGWTTHGHGGEDLFFYYYRPEPPAAAAGKQRRGPAVRQTPGDRPGALQPRPLLAADEAFPALGAAVAIDDSDPANKVLVVTQGAKTARLPFSKDIIRIGDREYRMNGLTVYADQANNGQGRVYVPREALEIFRRR